MAAPLGRQGLDCVIVGTGSAGRWVSRDEFAAYLARYAGACRCEVRTGVEVGDVSRHVRAVAAVHGMDGDRVLLADGTALRPDAVIAATGYGAGLPVAGRVAALR